MTPTWSPVALARDIAPGTAAPVLVDGREIVVWRGAGGGVRVWEDRCPHRGMRLSFGFVRGEELVCLYHGWRWGADSACNAIPAHPDLVPPKSLCANAYPACEHGGIVWMAVGEEPPEPPDAPTDAVPVATLLVARDERDVAAKLGATGPLVARAHLTIALHPLAPGRTLLHVVARLAEDTREARRAALATAERLRRDLETEDAR